MRSPQIAAMNSAASTRISHPFSEESGEWIQRYARSPSIRQSRTRGPPLLFSPVTCAIAFHLSRVSAANDSVTCNIVSRSSRRRPAPRALGSVLAAADGRRLSHGSLPAMLQEHTRGRTAARRALSRRRARLSRPLDLQRAIEFQPEDQWPTAPRADVRSFERFVVEGHLALELRPRNISARVASPVARRCHDLLQHLESPLQVHR